MKQEFPFDEIRRDDGNYFDSIDEALKKVKEYYLHGDIGHIWYVSYHDDLNGKCFEAVEKDKPYFKNFIGFVVTVLNHNDYIRKCYHERFSEEITLEEFKRGIEEYAVHFLSHDFDIKESIENEFQRLCEFRPLGMAVEQDNIFEILGENSDYLECVARGMAKDEAALAVIKNLVLEHAENISENTIKPR